jgi:hypothetical protein
MCMLEGLLFVRVSAFLFGVVTCLTIMYSGRSENDAAGR